LSSGLLQVAFLNEQNVVIICAEDEEGTPVYDNSLLVSPTMNLTVFLQPVQTVVNVTRTVAIPNQPGCVDFNFTPTALQPVTIGIFWNLDAIQDSPFVVPVLDNSSRPGVCLIVNVLYTTRVCWLYTVV
jgi:hypothetical protein